MPPIRVFADAPLHPQGVTPQTQPDEGSQNQNSNAPAIAPTRTTTAPATGSYDPSAPPPPQPGARPVQPTAGQPVPTGAASPPAPQPGPRPRDPPPSVIATHTTTYTSQHQITTPPPQFSIPPPTANIAAGTRSTQPITSPPQHAGLASIPQPSPFEPSSAPERHSLEHPPGYVQNPYAGEATAARRASISQAGRQQSEEDRVMGHVKGWLDNAGEGLKGLEEKAWRWAQGKG